MTKIQTHIFDLSFHLVVQDSYFFSPLFLIPFHPREITTSTGVAGNQFFFLSLSLSLLLFSVLGDMILTGDNSDSSVNENSISSLADIFEAQNQSFSSTSILPKDRSNSRRRLSCVTFLEQSESKKKHEKWKSCSPSGFQESGMDWTSVTSKTTTSFESSISSSLCLAPTETDSKAFLRHTSRLVSLYTNSWEQTALSSKKYVWMEYLCYTLIAIVMQLSFGWSYAFPDGRPACNYVGGQSSTTNRLMCDLKIELENGHHQLRVLVAFILGGFISTTIYLWRVRRTAYCALCGATRNLIIQIATLLPVVDDSHAAGYNIIEARNTMERWATLGFELAVLKARGQIDTVEARVYLETLGLTTLEEWNSMVEGDRHTTVWFWIQLKAVQLAEQGYISSEHRLQTICRAVTIIRDKANDLMSCIDRDQPVAYTSVVGLLVNLSLLIMALWKGISWAIWFYDTKGMIWATPKMYLDVLVTMSYNTVFAMLFDISQVLYNPFGTRKGLDIPHDIVGGGIRNLAKRLGTLDRCRPWSLTEDCPWSLTEDGTSWRLTEDDESSKSGQEGHIMVAPYPSHAAMETIEFEAMRVYDNSGRKSWIWNSEESPSNLDIHCESDDEQQEMV